MFVFQSSESNLDVVEAPSDIVLTEAERKFLLFVQRGDVASTRRYVKLLHVYVLHIALSSSSTYNTHHLFCTSHLTLLLPTLKTRTQ